MDPAVSSPLGGFPNQEGHLLRERREIPVQPRFRFTGEDLGMDFSTFFTTKDHRLVVRMAETRFTNLSVVIYW